MQNTDNRSRIALYAGAESPVYIASYSLIQRYSRRGDGDLCAGRRNPAAHIKTPGLDMLRGLMYDGTERRKP